MIVIEVVSVNEEAKHITVRAHRIDCEESVLLNFDVSTCTIDPMDWIAEQLYGILYTHTPEVVNHTRSWDLSVYSGRQYTYNMEDLNRINPIIPKDGSLNDLKSIIVEVLDELGIVR